jgi:hypothetical protein
MEKNMQNLPSEQNELYIDYDAILWAYYKLVAFGLGSSDNIDTWMMMDRLNLMLFMKGNNE